MRVNEDYDQIVKFLLIGDSHVGKTSILNRYCYGKFNNNQSSTVGLECGQKLVMIMKKKVLIQLWDTAGQQKFRSLTPSYYRSAMGIILVYSVDDRQSFNSIAVWIKQIKTFTDEDIPIILVCNKADILRKQVAQRQSLALAQAYHIDIVMTSCKQNINIDEIVNRLYSKVSHKNLQETRIVIGKRQQNRSSCFC